MIGDDLENLPALELPEDFHVTPVIPGSEMDFLRVVRRSSRETADIAWYREGSHDDPEYDPQNLLIIRKGADRVAVVVA